MGKKLEDNGLWESSRMMLPEHVKAIRVSNNTFFERTKKKPVLDELQLEELAQNLMEANETGDELVLTVWGRGTVEGRIVKLDPERKQVHVRKYGEVTKVPFFDILKAERPEW